MAGLRRHVDAHLSGQCRGEVPDVWMAEQNLVRCTVCRMSVGARIRCHPTCAAERRSRTEGRTSSHGLRAPSPGISLQSACSSPRTVKYVPAKARSQWASVFVRALAVAVHFNTTAAWTELAMLPGSVLCPPPAGSKLSSADMAAFTLDRISRWQAGERESLWADRTVAKPGKEGSQPKRKPCASSAPRLCAGRGC